MQSAESDREERAKEIGEMQEEPDEDAEMRQGGDAEVRDEGGQELKGDMLEAIEKIRSCTTQEDTEEAALAFCYANSRKARKRLVSTGSFH